MTFLILHPELDRFSHPATGQSPQMEHAPVSIPVEERYVRTVHVQLHPQIHLPLMNALPARSVKGIGGQDGTRSSP